MEYSIKPKRLGERRIIHYPQKRIIGLYVIIMFYKKLNKDGTLDMIGTQEVLPDNSVEITEEEYTELYQYIQENAVHEIVEEAG